VLVNLQTKPDDGVTSEMVDLIGRLLINDIVRSMRRRVRVRGRDPCGFYVYVDECHRFLSPDIAEALNECRQFGLRMILAHQNEGQLAEVGEALRQALHDSARLKAFMGLGSESAEAYADMAFSGEYDHTLVNEAFNSPTVVGYRKEVFKDYSYTESSGSSDSRGESSTTGKSATSGRSASESKGYEVGALHHDRTMKGGGANSSEGTSSSLTTNVLQASSQSSSETESYRTALVPELQWLPTKSVSKEEQKTIFVNRLRHQPVGHVWLLLPSGITAFPFITDYTVEKRPTEHLIDEFKLEYIESQSAYSLTEEILLELEDRQKQMIALDADLLKLQSTLVIEQDDGMPG